MPVDPLFLDPDRDRPPEVPEPRFPRWTLVVGAVIVFAGVFAGGLYSEPLAFACGAMLLLLNLAVWGWAIWVYRSHYGPFSPPPGLLEEIATGEKDQSFVPHTLAIVTSAVSLGMLFVLFERNPGMEAWVHRTFSHTSSQSPSPGRALRDLLVK